MEIDRRRLVIGLGAAAALARAGALGAHQAAARKTYDVVVAGAGCFGAWIAWHLARDGRSVLLVDPYGPANARASSGGESRVIRMSYGGDEIYTRFSWRSLAMWKQLFARAGRDELFQRTGVLWMARAGNQPAEVSLAALARAGIPHQRLAAADLVSRFSQLRVEPGGWAIWEPESGVLLARRAVAAVVEEAVARGVELRRTAALPPAPTPARSRLSEIALADGERVAAGAFVFACGPWLGKVVADALGGRIFPTRQEVHFFGVPPGDPRFDPPAMPTWLDFDGEWYGIPSLEQRGFKIANDLHGEAVDPDRLERVARPEAIAAARAFLAHRFPALAEAPLVESRVCQYENTSNGDFVLDRHPAFDDVFLAGGGSGHGFKHGPAVGEHVAALVAGTAPPEPRFALATKRLVQRRTVK